MEFELRHSTLKRTLTKIIKKFLNEKLDWFNNSLKTPIPEEK